MSAMGAPISAVGASIWTKFGSLMQNNVQISGKWSKSQPKVNFQYNGRLFFKNRYVDKIWLADRL